MRSSHRRLSGTAITSCVRNITSANKAPGGFGLGGNAKWLTEADDVNAISESGWYAWDSPHTPKNAINLAWSNIMRVDAQNAAVNAKTIYGVADNLLGAAFVARNMTYGSHISDWEYENPPMVWGTEYRTTERYLGKPVYCKLIDCGAVPDVNTNKTISFSCPGISRIISWTGNVDVGGNTFALPYHEIGREVNNASIYAFVNYTGITLRTSDSWFAENGGTAQCTIWYTKTVN